MSKFKWKQFTAPIHYGNFYVYLRKIIIFPSLTSPIVRLTCKRPLWDSHELLLYSPKGGTDTEILLYISKQGGTRRFRGLQYKV